MNLFEILAFTFLACQAFAIGATLEERSNALNQDHSKFPHVGEVPNNRRTKSVGGWMGTGVRNARCAANVCFKYAPREAGHAVVGGILNSNKYLREAAIRNAQDFHWEVRRPTQTELKYQLKQANRRLAQENAQKQRQGLLENGQ